MVVVVVVVSSSSSSSSSCSSSNSSSGSSSGRSSISGSSSIYTTLLSWLSQPNRTACVRVCVCVDILYQYKVEYNNTISTVSLSCNVLVLKPYKICIDALSPDTRLKCFVRFSNGFNPWLRFQILFSWYSCHASGRLCTHWWARKARSTMCHQVKHDITVGF